MAKERITVWVQRMKDRRFLMLQWMDPHTGKRCSKSAGTDDEGDAEQARADLEYELNNGLHKRSARMSWERFRELFEAEFVSAKRPKTRKNYRTVLDAFERVCSPRQVGSVNTRMVSAFAAGLRREPGPRGKVAQPGTIHVYLEALHAALTWAKEQGFLAELPKFPEVKVPKRKPQPVPAELFDRLLAVTTDPAMRAFLLCGWLAGMRLNEAFELGWEPTDEAPWIDLNRDRVVFPAGFVKAAEDQWVPLDPDLRDALESLPRQGRKVFRFVDTKGRAVDAPALGMRVKRLARDAKVKLTMRTLRRGFGCRYAGKVSAHVLQRLMRHSNLQITTTYYANFDEAIEEAVLGKPEDRKKRPAAGGNAAPNGPERNSLRNTSDGPAELPSRAEDATP